MTGLVASVDLARLGTMLIGVEQLKLLTNLLLISKTVGDRHVLLEQMMVRVKHTKLFANKRGYDSQDKYFLAGMLSMIDVCTRIKLDKVLGELPLPNKFICTIVHRSGRVGNAFDLVEYYNTGCIIKDQQDFEYLTVTYLSAVKRVDEFLVAI